MPHKKIVWTCSVCDKPVEDDDGYVTMDMVEATRVAEERETWQESNPENERAARLETHPKPAPWRVFHLDCDPVPDREVYSIDVDRIRSSWAALAWTAHLMRKPWLATTDWDVIIERVAATHGGTRAKA